MKIEDVFGIGDFVVLDTETSGLTACTDAPIEVAILPVHDWEPEQPVWWIVNPNYPEKFNVPEEIEALTGITTEQVAAGADPKVFYPGIIQLIDGRRMWGHNVSMFDKRFVDCECRRVCTVPPKESQWFDTATLFKADEMGIIDELSKYDVFQDFSEKVLTTPVKGLKYNLPYACARFDVDTSDIKWHRAGHDCTATMRLLLKMYEKFMTA